MIANGDRNPFRITVRPGTNEVWVGDVGEGLSEEINRVADPGAPMENFGWPCYEGNIRQPYWDAADFPICENLYAEGSTTGPYFTYDHTHEWSQATGARIAGGSVISGLDFYQGGGYPAKYQGALFFADGTRSCIYAMPTGSNGLPNPAAVELFASNAGFPVDLRTGPGGDIFFLDVGAGSLRRIHYDASNAPPNPVIDAVPTSGPPPLTVNLDGSRSSRHRSW